MDPITKEQKQSTIVSTFVFFTSKLYALLKAFRSFIALLMYLALLAPLSTFDRRYIVLILMFITCLLFKSYFMKMMMICFTIVLIFCLYVTCGYKYDYDIYKFLGIISDEPVEIDVEDIFFDDDGYCYFAIEDNDPMYFDQFVDEENFEGETQHWNAKEFCTSLLRIPDLITKTFALINDKINDKTYYVGFDEDNIEIIKKSYNPFMHKIIRNNTFDTMNEINEKNQLGNGYILSFYMDKNSDIYRIYKTEARKNNYNAVLFIVNMFFYCDIGSNNNQVMYFYCCKDKVLKRLKIYYEPVIEFEND